MSADYLEDLTADRQVLGAHANAEGSTWFTRRRTWPWATGGPQLPKLRRPAGKPGSRMIASATGLLFLLGAGLLGVSLAAQYRYLLHERHQHWASLTEALALDLGMLIFSLLALGLARAGKPAKAERLLIIGCAVGSAVMNYAASDVTSPRSVLAYVMPPIFLAVVADRVISVVRRHYLGDTEASAWQAAGRFSARLVRAGGVSGLYVLRLVLAPRSTVVGGRRLVLAATPLPGSAERRATEALAAQATAALEAGQARAELERGIADHQAEAARITAEAQRAVSAVREEARNRIAAAEDTARREVTAAGAGQAGAEARALAAQQEMTQLRQDAARERAELRAALDARAAGLVAGQDELRVRAERADSEADRARIERDAAAGAAVEAEAGRSLVTTAAASAVAAIEEALGRKGSPEAWSALDALRAACGMGPAPKQAPAGARITAHRPVTKTAAFLEAVAEKHGPLASFPLEQVSPVASDLAPAIGLDPGSARRELRKAVLAVQQATQDEGARR